jgi:glycosyltransferase involved in cell wall biosynthesis
LARHDVAIYAPSAALLYERQPGVTGGAERQTVLLAQALLRAGLRVAHIVLPVEEPDPALPDSLTLVQRRLVTTRRGPAARLAQLREVVSALRDADADVYVFRSGLPALGITALFCRARGRRLIFASSNDLDFTFDFYDGRGPELRVYRYGVAHADAVVVQTEAQTQLARHRIPGLTRVVEVPSFAQSAPLSTARPEAFLWAGRLDRYKQPLRYIELAEAMPDARFRMIPRQLDPERAGGSPGADPDEAMEREALDRAAALPNLEILEQRPHADVMQLLERSVAIVNTGAAEGLPNLFLEAWARGIPALSYEFDPNGRIARHGLGVAADGSRERFLQGARELWDGRDARECLSLHVRGYLESTHGVDAVGRRWSELVDELRRS